MCIYIDTYKYKADVEQVLFIPHSYKNDFINGCPFDNIPSEVWFHTRGILSFKKDMLEVKSTEGFLLLFCHNAHV